MKTDSFTEQYKHPKWQKKRLEIFKRDNYTCRLCKSTENQLHAHHLEYKRGKKAWEYLDDNFITLCDSCHAEVTDILSDTKRNMSDPMFISAVSTLLQLWKYPNHECIVFIMSILCDWPDLIDSTWMTLISRERKLYAPKISKTGNNQ